MRLLVAPFQWYRNEVLVGVYAAANYGGSLIDNMGIETVIAHYEGSRIFIEEPSYQTIIDANGNPRRYFGWWVRLKHDGRSGHARLYFEAVAKDVSMQRRVIGPYQFSPQPAVYSHEVEVAATPAQITGQRYKTILAAFNYLKSVNATNPRITITEAGSYVLDGVTNGWGNGSWNKGYVHVEANAPVSLVRPAPASNAARSPFRPTCALHIKGSNITVDFAEAAEFYHADTTGRDHWFDGINMTNSKGRYDLYMKSLVSAQGWLLRPSVSEEQGTWVTECAFTNTWHSLTNVSLARGNTLTGCWYDIFNSSACIIGNRIDDHDGEDYTRFADALTVIYTGGGGAATLQRSLNTLTARVDNVVVGTFTIDGSLSGFNANTNYTVQNVVDWLNGLSGFNATMIDNSRAAWALVADGYTRDWGPMSVKGVTLSLKTSFDLHTDWWQRKDLPAYISNIVIADNVTTNFVGKNFFWGQMDDSICINNCWHNSEGIYGAGGGNVTNLSNSRSQIGGVQRHVIHAHNSCSSQQLNWGMNGSSPFNPDTYCLFANNVFPAFSYTGGSPDPDLVPIDNHMMDGFTPPPVGTSGSTQGGSETTLFADAAAGDFTPLGALLAVSKPSRLPYDAKGKQRVSATVPGARSPV